MEKLGEVCKLASQMRALLDEMGPSREVSSAKTKVDEAVMWAKEHAQVQARTPLKPVL